MFATTPRLRDRLDLRTVVIVAAIAAGAFGLQLVFLAGMVAHPLGGAIVAYEEAPQVERAPPEAIARARDDATPLRDVTAGARLTWERPPLAEAAGTFPRECLIYR